MRALASGVISAVSARQILAWLRLLLRWLRVGSDSELDFERREDGMQPIDEQ